MHISRACRRCAAFVPTVVAVGWLMATLKQCCLAGDGPELRIVLGVASIMVAWTCVVGADRIGQDLGWWT